MIYLIFLMAMGQQKSCWTKGNALCRSWKLARVAGRSFCVIKVICNLRLYHVSKSRHVRVDWCLDLCPVVFQLMWRLSIQHPGGFLYPLKQFYLQFVSDPVTRNLGPHDRHKKAGPSGSTGPCEQSLKLKLASFRLKTSLSVCPASRGRIVKVLPQLQFSVDKAELLLSAPW